LLLLAILGASAAGDCLSHRTAETVSRQVVAGNYRWSAQAACCAPRQLIVVFGSQSLLDCPRGQAVPGNWRHPRSLLALGPLPGPNPL